MKLFQRPKSGSDLYRGEKYVDFSVSRPGQDVRYALNDNKLKNLGWAPEKLFDEEIGKIVKHCRNSWRW